MEILTMVSLIKWQEIYDMKYNLYLAGAVTLEELASLHDDLSFVSKYMTKGDFWDVPADVQRLSKIVSRALRDDKEEETE